MAHFFYCSLFFRRTSSVGAATVTSSYCLKLLAKEPVSCEQRLQAADMLSYVRLTAVLPLACSQSGGTCISSSSNANAPTSETLPVLRPEDTRLWAS